MPIIDRVRELWKMLRQSSPQVLLNLNLPSYLFLYATFDNLTLVQALECKDEMRRCLCPDHIYASELSFAQRPSHFQRGKTPFFGPMQSRSVRFPQVNISFELSPARRSHRDVEESSAKSSAASPSTSLPRPPSNSLSNPPS